MTISLNLNTIKHPGYFSWGVWFITQNIRISPLFTFYINTASTHFHCHFGSIIC
nr:MAG TPA: hypothetical protein [Caudoviricetes sp.]